MAVLDTSFLVDILRNQPEAVRLLDDLESKEPSLQVTTPTVMELWEGALQSRLSEKEKKKVDDLLSCTEILPLDEQGAKRAAEVSVILARQGTSVETEDIMIAAIALTHGETIVTSDPHFTRIPGLKVLKY